MKNEINFNVFRFLETAGTVLNYFESFLGRIEIKTAEKVKLDITDISGIKYSLPG